MGKEHTIAKAETVVFNAETKHLNKLIKEYQLKKKYGINVAWPYLEDLTVERERLDPKGKWDQEEVFIATGEYPKKHII